MACTTSSLPGSMLVFPRNSRILRAVLDRAVAGALATGVLSCGGGGGGGGGGSTGPGNATDVGTPTGDLVSATIGAAGGSVAAGALRVVIPAGGCPATPW